MREPIPMVMAVPNMTGSTDATEVNVIVDVVVAAEVEVAAEFVTTRVVWEVRVSTIFL